MGETRRATAPLQYSTVRFDHTCMEVAMLQQLPQRALQANSESRTSTAMMVCVVPAVCQQ